MALFTDKTVTPFPIPVVAGGAIGPGSQEESGSPEVMPSPGDMRVFRLPLPPEPDALAPALAGQLKACIAELADGLDAWLAASSAAPGSAPAPCLDLAPLSADLTRLLDETLGEGEVSGRGGDSLRVQETAFAGLWKVLHADETGALRSHRLEVAAIPADLVDAFPEAPPPAPAPRPGLMNGEALYRELVERSRRYRPGQPAHVMNLTLLPVTPDDLSYLDEGLGRGRVSLLSRGYGNCRLTATGLPHVWWVQYFNAMDTLILNTLEVVDMPEAALAAREDFEDTAERLRELLGVLDGDEAPAADGPDRIPAATLEALLAEARLGQAGLDEPEQQEEQESSGV
ncbi:hydrogenase expression/formation protein [Oryzomicrobium sp.]|uniref:hydrogenase expression/formation protein n=1 Tax=Oryzomicrobium sp. TaxID=1911578 RepID=UPI0025D2CD80|nr:hydrogenase expression/formation protein [Oryzomicrobium sp.]MCE1244891.1 hydrogenase expression/formation protein [Oryzomicrobium sp.]